MTSIWCVKKNRIDIERRQARFAALKKIWAAQDFRIFGREDLSGLKGQTPDILIVFGPEASAAVRDTDLGAKRLKVFVPGYWDGRLQRELAEIRAGGYDLLLPTDLPWIDEFMKIHPSVHYVGRGFDPEIFYLDPTVERTLTVAFIGNPDGFDRHRRLTMIKDFLPRGKFLSISGKNHRDVAGYLRKTLIGWNQILHPRSKRGINYRVWEVTACGAALFTNPTQDMNKIFKDGVNVIFWRDDREIIDRLDHYIRRKPERLAAIARRGCELAHSEYTWDHKAREFADLIWRYL